MGKQLVLLHLNQTKKMKKILAIAFFLLYSTTSFAINFDIEGRLLARTCKVKSGYENLLVLLPSVAAYKLNGSGKTAGYTPFHIELSECENVKLFEGKSLFAFFESERVDASNAYTLLNAADANSANNVNIQLTNGDTSAIQVSNQSIASATFKPSESYKDIGTATIQDGITAYTLKYGAQYYSTGKAKAGLVEGFSTFSIQYK